MNTGVKNIKDQWITEAGQKFSFECRLAVPITLEHNSANNGFEYITFIIEVSGFFYDKEHTKPIKLHHERTITIDTTNCSQQNIDNFRRDLNLLTGAAHEEFLKVLEESPQPIYTSDPLYMK